MNLKERVEKAKEALLSFDCDEIIVISRNYRDSDSIITVSTYGKDKKACKQAAQVGQQFTKLINSEPKNLESAIATFNGGEQK